MEKLTRMQQRIYDYIAETIREQGYPPSVREIGDAVGLKSPSTVHFHLKHLAELGVIGKEAGKGRAITLTNPLPREDQVPVVGSVAAGSPILAQECIEDTVKRYSRRNGQVWLLPENENYQPIDGREAVLMGRVDAVIRRY